MTTRTRTPERIEFLRDIFTTALEGGSNYWAHVEEYKIWVVPSAAASDLVERDDPQATIADQVSCAEERLTVTIDTIAKGLGLIARGEAAFSNPGYRETAKRIALLDRTNGAEGDYDADDADCILQIGLFGEVAYQ